MSVVELCRCIFGVNTWPCAAAVNNEPLLFFFFYSCCFT